MSRSYAQSSASFHPQRRKMYVRQRELDELFDHEELVVKLQVAQNRIVEAFVHATEWHRGKMCKTDNYIPFVGPERKDLVRHIIDHVLIARQHGIVTSSELPKFLGDNPRVLKAVAHDANERLIAIRLLELCQKKLIWHNAYEGGIWQTCQSVIDQYYAEISYVRAIRKIDERLRREGLHGGGRLEVVH